ncbi:hypothetical protein Cyrtocomes_00047 [Candidatus Cyrtobacter comes]|uniref:Uncharacterized protein n=1 Tax=Candidatus Cyrtobacter comes TaxID=675776 RepID=A0ABU5L722_9RICK|nr:hypothetical protein [Candidatus Cyrtobacter comes]MDZ5761690.1 hypothetical protein [Candidatus Cyrtobacter comes]
MAGGWLDYSMFGYLSSNLKKLQNAQDSGNQGEVQTLINKIRSDINHYK